MVVARIVGVVAMVVAMMIAVVAMMVAVAVPVPGCGWTTLPTAIAPITPSVAAIFPTHDAFLFLVLSSFDDALVALNAA
jgi:hypothetical protein